MIVSHFASGHKRIIRRITLPDISPIFINDLGIDVDDTATCPVAVLTVLLRSGHPVFDATVRVEVIPSNPASITGL
jgi:hypothetical protein